MALLRVKGDVKIVKVLEETAQSGKTFYTVIGWFSGQKQLIYCPADALPGDPGDLEGQELKDLPLLIEAPRFEVKIRAAG